MKVIAEDFVLQLPDILLFVAKLLAPDLALLDNI